MGGKNYNFKEREKHWRQFWEKEKIYRFNPKSKKEFYAVDTPPPYISADRLHPGHIMSYSQAEFIVRFKRMNGFEVFYPMGFDDNGLPTERFVEKKYHLDKNNISRPDFIKKCLEETKIGSQIYKNLWQLLGISVDWTKTYSTIDAHCQKIAQWSFLDLYRKGKLSRKEEPIYWCPFCQTALAQADLEEKEEETFFNFIGFPIESGEKLLIATTRPELLPGCVALFYHPADERYKHLAGKKARVPLFNYEVPILSDSQVETKLGTGLMMVCTWGDNEDVRRVKEHNLGLRLVVGRDGRMNELAGDFSGLTQTEARGKILEKLKAEGFLVKQEKIIHNVPVHERCATPVEFIKTKQWFCDILNAKEKLLAQGDKMNWYPLEMKQKFIDWVSALKWDWCISRQRYYGVPFPVWYCASCEEIILPQEKDLPVDPVNEKPKIKKCPRCGCREFLPEKDVMDTWMTSSLTPLLSSRLVKDKNAQKKLFPASLRPQAFEIIRTWLFYTVVKSLFHFGEIPFRDIMISGHGLDASGRKFSKRLGNYTDPEKIIEEYGADALRYWATGAALGRNLRYSENEVKKGKRTVIKLWNAAQFCFFHFQGKDFSKAPLKMLAPEDKWILHTFNETVKKVTDNFNKYSYAKAKSCLEEFFWSCFCDNYLEFVKPRLYRSEPDKIVPAVLYQCLLGIIKMYAPFLPFISEELYQAYFRKFEKTKSIHLSSWPAPLSLEWTSEELAAFNRVLDLIKEIRAFKSQKGISLNKKIPEFVTEISLPQEMVCFVENVCQVGKIIFKS